MLMEWLEKEASKSLVKTAAHQFEEELAALDTPTIAKLWRDAKRKEAKDYEVRQVNLDPRTAARQGAIGGALGGGLAGAYGGAAAGGAAAGGPGALMGAGLGGLAGVGLGGGMGYGLGALKGHFDAETYKANILARKRLEEELAKEKNSSVNILRLALQKSAEKRERGPNEQTGRVLGTGAGAAMGALPGAAIGGTAGLLHGARAHAEPARKLVEKAERVERLSRSPNPFKRIRGARYRHAVKQQAEELAPKIVKSMKRRGLAGALVGGGLGAAALGGLGAAVGSEAGRASD